MMIRASDYSMLGWPAYLELFESPLDIPAVWMARPSHIIFFGRKLLHGISVWSIRDVKHERRCCLPFGAWCTCQPAKQRSSITLSSSCNIFHLIIICSIIKIKKALPTAINLSSSLRYLYMKEHWPESKFGIHSAPKSLRGLKSDPQSRLPLWLFWGDLLGRGAMLKTQITKRQWCCLKYTCETGSL